MVKPIKPGAFLKGYDPRRGRGPKKGAPNAGRPRDEFIEAMRALASRKEVGERLKELLTDKDTPPETFLRAYQETVNRGYGKPTQYIEHGGDGTLRLLVQREGPTGEREEDED